MVKDEMFQERVVRIEKPSSHFTLLRAPHGKFLGVSDSKELSVFDYVDDKAIWETGGRQACLSSRCHRNST